MMLMGSLGSFGYYSAVAVYKSCQQILQDTFWTSSKREGDSLQGKLFDTYSTNVADSKGHSLVIDTLPPIDDVKIPKYPVVLCHGLSGFDRLILIPSVKKLLTLLQLSVKEKSSDLFMETADDTNSIWALDYWLGVQTFLESKGCAVITAKVPSFGSIEERAEVLNKFIADGVKKLDQEHRGKFKLNSEGKIKVNLIAHSMGGLDCRYLISKIENKEYDVKSLTTIATPHHGSEMADYVVEKFNSFKETANLSDMPLFLPPAFYQLTTYHMKHFNNIVPNDSNVSYFSYGSYFYPKWYNVFYPSWNIIYNKSNGEPNDGLVSTKSSRWGQYLGSLDDIDHLDIINWRNKLNIDVIMGLDRNCFRNKNVQPQHKIDILHFYLTITDMLARKGL
ncbi:HCL589Cp [Eremothecium sinecaudum]|uniref:GPI inositol-deacylase n=1 Tax=Eremothecium sinecaudum TaxID=45286 RepID=A0A120K1N5_9SACH|nr:HCL589Cp [Eremothecium sinecaudum]AMD19562.1 HCL589Cp [Eremothecium sinecaudum]